MKQRKSKFNGPSPIAVTFGANKNYFSHNEDLVECLDSNKENQNTIETSSAL